MTVFGTGFSNASHAPCGSTGFPRPWGPKPSRSVGWLKHPQRSRTRSTSAVHLKNGIVDIQWFKMTEFCWMPLDAIVLKFDPYSSNNIEHHYHDLTSVVLKCRALWLDQFSVGTQPSSILQHHSNERTSTAVSRSHPLVWSLGGADAGLNPARGVGGFRRCTTLYQQVCCLLVGRQAQTTSSTHQFNII
jgi:hypothetical protein